MKKKRDQTLFSQDKIFVTTKKKVFFLSFHSAFSSLVLFISCSIIVVIWHVYEYICNYVITRVFE